MLNETLEKYYFPLGKMSINSDLLLNVLHFPHMVLKQVGPGACSTSIFVYRATKPLELRPLVGWRWVLLDAHCTPLTMFLVTLHYQSTSSISALNLGLNFKINHSPLLLRSPASEQCSLRRTQLLSTARLSVLFLFDELPIQAISFNLGTSCKTKDHVFIKHFLWIFH